MGSEWHTKQWKLIPEKELREKWTAFMQAQRDYYGSNPYSGSFATTSGLVVEERVFDDHDKAEDYLLDKCEKWGSAIAVKVKDYWLIGAWCAS